MNWLKSILLDIVVTALILLGVIFQIYWLKVIILVYSALILVVRTAVLFNEDTLRSLFRRIRETPSWPLHILYGINVVVLLAGSWYTVSLLWILIWIFSALSERKAKQIGGA
ncbi:MAG TPA: hypothetical protein VKA68_18065 [bacterium]|nr:hypothetical protein [bacterium]